MADINQVAENVDTSVRSESFQADLQSAFRRAEDWVSLGSTDDKYTSADGTQYTLKIITPEGKPENFRGHTIVRFISKGLDGRETELSFSTERPEIPYFSIISSDGTSTAVEDADEAADNELIRECVRYLNSTEPAILRAFKEDMDLACAGFEAYARRGGLQEHFTKNGVRYDLLIMKSPKGTFEEDKIYVTFTSVNEHGVVQYLRFSPDDYLNGNINIRRAINPSGNVDDVFFYDLQAVDLISQDELMQELVKYMTQPS